jgi:hypothetical protein
VRGYLKGRSSKRCTARHRFAWRSVCLWSSKRRRTRNRRKWRSAFRNRLWSWRRLTWTNLQVATRSGMSCCTTFSRTLWRVNSPRATTFLISGSCTTICCARWSNFTSVRPTTRVPSNNWKRTWIWWCSSFPNYWSWTWTMVSWGFILTKRTGIIGLRVWSVWVRISSNSLWRR